MAKLDEYRRKRKFDKTPEPSGDGPETIVEKKQAPRKKILGEAPTSGEEDARWKAYVASNAGKKKGGAESEGRDGEKGGERGKNTGLKTGHYKEHAREHGDTFVVQKHSATRLHYDFRLAMDGVLKSWAVPKGPSLNPDDKRLAVETEDHPLDYAGFEGKIPEGNYGAGTVMVWDRGTFSPIGEMDALTQIERGEIKFHLNGEKLRGSFVLVKLKHGEKKNEWLMIKHKDADVDPSWDIDRHDG